VLDADAIVAYQQQASGAEVGADPLATLAASPIWNRLGTVRDERVFVLGDAWASAARSPRPTRSSTISSPRSSPMTGRTDDVLRATPTSTGARGGNSRTCLNQRP
jgi:hypothetical protein